MNNKSNGIDNKPKPFIAWGSTEKISEEDRKRSIQYERKMLEIGINLNKFCNSADLSEVYENPYRMKAVELIESGNDVPEELKKKMFEYDKKLKTNNNTV